MPYLQCYHVHHLQQFLQWSRWLSGKMLPMMPHVGVQFPLVLKFLLFFLTSYTLIFIVICDLFSLTFILIITCTNFMLNYITYIIWKCMFGRMENNQIWCLLLMYLACVWRISPCYLVLHCRMQSVILIHT